MGNVIIESLRQQVQAGLAAEDQLIALLTGKAREDEATDPAESADGSTDATAAEEELTKLLLDRIQRGGKAARDELFRHVNRNMRESAARLVPKDNATIQPTMLVHDAFVDLLDSPNISWADRKHFLSYASGRMYQLFIDYKRKRDAEIRGGGRPKADVNDVEVPILETETDFEARLRTLKMLREQDQVCYEVILLRYYADLTVNEVAALIGVHPNTVKNKTSTALAVLKAELQDGVERA